MHHKVRARHRRLYVVLTADIHVVGGMQLYTSSKAEYLESEGWTIRILFSGPKGGSCDINYFNNYTDGGFYALGMPPYFLGKKKVAKEICDMLEYLNVSNEYSETVIESQDDCGSQWGELLANQLSARHICLLCNEVFEGPGKYYKQLLDFYDFKLRRKELAGNINNMRALFGDYRDVSEDEVPLFYASEGNPVRDVEDERISLIAPSDWTICYIGRAEKSYVPNVIDGVCEFANRYKNRMIQFVMVGDISKQRSWIEKSISGVDNLSLVALGNMVPIPRNLYEHVDLVIAGSGCARYSMKEGALTIAANSENNLSSGLLGYETFDSVYTDNPDCLTSFDQAIERALIDKVQEHMTYKPPEYPSSDLCYADQIELLNGAASSIEYYPFECIVNAVPVSLFNRIKAWIVLRSDSTMVNMALGLRRWIFNRIRIRR